MSAAISEAFAVLEWVGAQTEPPTVEDAATGAGVGPEIVEGLLRLGYLARLDGGRLRLGGRLASLAGQLARQLGLGPEVAAAHRRTLEACYSPHKRPAHGEPHDGGVQV